MPKTYKSWANGYRALVDTGYKKGKDYRTGVIPVLPTDNWEDRIVEIGTTGGMTRWDAGTRANQSDIREGYDKRFTQVRYSEEVPIGTLAEKFQGNDVRLTKRATTGLGKDGYLLQQKAAFSILGYGFADTNTYLTGINGTTVSNLGPDGKRFFSVVHVCSPENSTTWSNALSDNAAVGEDALEAMIQNLNNQLDDRGAKMHFGDSGYVWLVTLEGFPEAVRTVSSDLRPEVDSNSVNVYKGAFDGRPIEVRWVPWLSDFGSTTCHFLVARDAIDNENFIVLESQPFMVDDYIDPTTDTAFVRARNTFAVGFASARGWVGSQGTGTGSYSA